MNPSRRSLLIASLPTFGGLAACGGGGGDDTPATFTAGPAADFSSYTSRINATTYPLRIHVPPGTRSTMPLVVALDGESWFDLLVSLSGSAARPFIVVALGMQVLRSRDYVPSNLCTAGGGGHEAFFSFITQELVPDLQARYGGDASRRALFGHSHGGSFVLYALFAQAAGQHTFASYVSCDASIQCMPDTVYGWEAAYRARQATLPARLHLSYASQGNAAVNQQFGLHMAGRAYAQLGLQTPGYGGTHSGVVPQVYADAAAFSFS